MVDDTIITEAIVEHPDYSIRIYEYSRFMNEVQGGLKEMLRTDDADWVVVCNESADSHIKMWAEMMADHLDTTSQPRFIEYGDLWYFVTTHA